MKEVSKIFFGVIVQAFYKTYASLFFLAGGVVFGFMRRNDHVALGELFII